MVIDEKKSDDEYITTKPGMVEYTCPNCKVTYIFDEKYLKAVNYAKSLPDIQPS